LFVRDIDDLVTIYRRKFIEMCKGLRHILNYFFYTYIKCRQEMGKGQYGLLVDVMPIYLTNQQAVRELVQVISIDPYGIRIKYFSY